MKKSIIVLLVLSIILLGSGLVLNNFNQKVDDSSNNETNKDNTNNDNNDKDVTHIVSYECVSSFETIDENTSELLRTLKTSYKFSVEDNKITSGSFQEWLIFSSADEYNSFSQAEENKALFTFDDDNLTVILQDEVVTYINEDTNSDVFSQAYLKQFSDMNLECKKVSE